nr:MAG TPA: hypothetical protein [Caudoviricetes sp.]
MFYCLLCHIIKIKLIQANKKRAEQYYLSARSLHYENRKNLPKSTSQRSYEKPRYIILCRVSFWQLC